jgi:Na+(H+)/acetate symporter ActP
MSKRIRALILGATLVAMHLAGMTAVAQAQANDEPVRQPPTERQVGESWRHRQAASQEQTAADAALQRVLARERFSIPNQTPAHVPAPAPPQPTGQPGWLLAALTALSAVLAVVTGLAMVAARRANRRARVGPAT